MNICMLQKTKTKKYNAHKMKMQWQKWSYNQQNLVIILTDCIRRAHNHYFAQNTNCNTNTIYTDSWSVTTDFPEITQMYDWCLCLSEAFETFGRKPKPTVHTLSRNHEQSTDVIYQNVAIKLHTRISYTVDKIHANSKKPFQHSAASCCYISRTLSVVPFLPRHYTDWVTGPWLESV